MLNLMALTIGAIMGQVMIGQSADLYTTIFVVALATIINGERGVK